MIDMLEAEARSDRIVAHHYEKACVSDTHAFTPRARGS